MIQGLETSFGPLRSCTMIITEPSDFVREVHDCMPVLLEPDQFTAWLDGRQGIPEACASNFAATMAGFEVRQQFAHARMIRLVEPVALQRLGPRGKACPSIWKSARLRGYRRCS